MTQEIEYDIALQLVFQYALQSPDFIYFIELGDSSKKTELIIVEQGNMVFTPPLVEHCMKFPEDTLFLTLSRNPRDQKTYEADVVRVDLIDSSSSISWKPN